MAPRLVFEWVYDYVPGKMDWLSFGLGHEGDATLAGDVMHRDVLTCPVEARLGDVQVRLAEEGAAYCVATGAALRANPARTIEEVMEVGATTVRPSEEVGPLRERMRRARRDSVLVTNSDGRLLGLLLGDVP